MWLSEEEYFIIIKESSPQNIFSLTSSIWTTPCGPALACTHQSASNSVAKVLCSYLPFPPKLPLAVWSLLSETTHCFHQAWRQDVIGAITNWQILFADLGMNTMPTGTNVSRVFHAHIAFGYSLSWRLPGWQRSAKEQEEILPCVGSQHGVHALKVSYEPCFDNAAILSVFWKWVNSSLIT